MTSEPSGKNVYSPRRTPLLIGIVLLVLIIAAIALSAALLLRESPDKPVTTPKESITSTPPSGRPNGTTSPQTTASPEPTTTPEVTSGSPPVTTVPGPISPVITTTTRTYNKTTPSTITANVSAADVFRGALILIDDTHSYDFPVEKMISRTEMSALSAATLRSDYGFVRLPSSPYYVRKNSKLFLNAEAADEFGKMMNAYAAESGNTDVEVRNAYYYAPNDPRGLYNCTGLYVDLDIVKEEGTYPLNYELFRSDYYDWFVENCHRFGFIHAGEGKSSSGHDSYSAFRYIGIPHATYMHEFNISSLSAYLDLVKSHPIEKTMTITDEDDVAWQVYYVPALSGSTAIDLTATPNGYTVSGNNTDGYIVTINTAYFA